VNHPPSIADGLQFNACRLPHRSAIATGVTSVALAHFAAGDLPIALRLRIQLKWADV
jgi:hypothetical protein